MDGYIEKVRTITTAGTVTVLSSDGTIAINQTTGAAINVQLPIYPRKGRRIRIKDEKGDAATNSITVLPNTGDTVNKAASYVISSNNASITFLYNFDTANWMVVA